MKPKAASWGNSQDLENDSKSSPMATWPLVAVSICTLHASVFSHCLHDQPRGPLMPAIHHHHPYLEGLLSDINLGGPAFNKAQSHLHREKHLWLTGWFQASPTDLGWVPAQPPHRLPAALGEGVGRLHRTSLPAVSLAFRVPQACECSIVLPGHTVRKQTNAAQSALHCSPWGWGPATAKNQGKVDSLMRAISVDFLFCLF